MDPTMTRRSAIRAGTLSALAAGLLGTAGTPTAVAAEPQAVTVVNTDDLAATCQRLHAELLKTQEDQTQIEDEIANAVGATMRDAYDTSMNLYWFIHQEWMAAELARHLPGLAPTLRMLQNHIIATAYQHPGTCCTVAEGFEP